MPRRMPKKKAKRRKKRFESRGKKFTEKIKPGWIDYKDTDLLRRFLTKQGRIMSRKRTNVTARQQRAVTIAVKRARHMALMPYHGQKRK